MRKIHIICVSRPLGKELSVLEENYVQRASLFQLEFHVIKPSTDGLVKENERIQKKLQQLQKKSSGNGWVVAMDEKGQMKKSTSFSEWVFKKFDQYENIFFLIGGSYGLNKETLSLCHESLSLSPMTFPHKLARVFLVEQCIRAQAIHTGHPYHHE